MRFPQYGRRWAVGRTIPRRIQARAQRHGGRYTEIEDAPPHIPGHVYGSPIRGDAVLAARGRPCPKT